MSLKIPRFFRDHLKGDHSLLQVVFLSIILVNLLFMVVDALGSIVGIVENPVIRNQIYMVWVVFLFGVVVLWQWVGLFNSCKYNIIEIENYSGVIVAVVAAITASWMLFHVSFPSSTVLQQSVLTARAIDAYETDFQLLDESTLEISGGLSFGSYRKAADLISQHGIKTLRLNITEGQLYEARMLADISVKAKLKIEVFRNCFAPCTLVLASGSYRKVSNDANIGFQSYKILYPDERSSWFVDRKQKSDIERLKKLGVDSKFVFQSFYSRKNEPFWRPGVNRLLTENYIDEIVSPLL